MLANAHAVNINNTDANNTKIILDLLFIIQALCRHLYLVVGMFRKAQDIVVIFLLFHMFRDYLSVEGGFLVALRF